MNKYPKAQSVAELERGLKVDVYKNLHNGKWSIRDRSTGRVVAHVDECAVSDAQFVVQEAGRRRVLEEGRKNVHAFVRGNLSYSDMLWRLPSSNAVAVTYNPYKSNTFVEKETREPIREATIATLGMECHAWETDYAKQ